MFFDSTTILAARPITVAILDLIQRSLPPCTTELIGCGLPSGARLFHQPQLVIAGTVCTVPLFAESMTNTAKSRGVDVLLCRHDTYPELLSAVLWDATIRTGAHLVSITDLVLYAAGADDLWLLPSRSGPFVRVAADGLHLEIEPPFRTWTERCDGVCEGAKRIIQATRPVLGA